MPRSHYARRFDALARERTSSLAVPMRPGFDAGPAGGHPARVRRALALAVASGISPEDAYPVVLRALAGIGIYVRPIHFMPVWVPLVIGALFGGGFASISFVLVEAAVPLVPALAPLAQSEALWTAAGAACLGILFAALIRMQALRSRLPRWSEI